MTKPIAENRRARYDYFIEETVEAGLMLTGTEVKSLRVGRANIAESYASVEGREIKLINADIPPYGHANRFNHEPRRHRLAITIGHHELIGGRIAHGVEKTRATPHVAPALCVKSAGVVAEVKKFGPVIRAYGRRIRRPHDVRLTSIRELEFGARATVRAMDDQHAELNARQPPPPPRRSGSRRGIAQS